MHTVAPLRLVQPSGRRVASAVPVISPICIDAESFDPDVVPISRISDRDAVAVATWIAEHLPAYASPLRGATATDTEKNWIALDALGADHRRVNWPAVIGARREIASVPWAAGDFGPTA